MAPVPGMKYLQNKYLQQVLIHKYLRLVSWAPGELLATSCNHQYLGLTLLHYVLCSNGDTVEII